MKTIFKDIKNFLPYLALIFIYFFFVNIEAKKSRNENHILNKNNRNENNLKDNKKENINRNLRISIPVIPYVE